MGEFEEFFDALDKIERELPTREALDVDLKELCKKIREMTPLIRRILPFLEKFGGKFKTIAEIVRMLLKVAEACCKELSG
jgi:hypothetical protein